MRLSLIAAVIVASAALVALGRWRNNGPNPFVLQVPATYFSAGQQFQPRLVSLVPDARAASDSIALTLWNSTGQRVADEQVFLAPAAVAAAAPLSLPQPGAYVLRASTPQSVQIIHLRAMPDAAADFGGVLQVATLGVSAGVNDFLRAHSFAVAEANVAAPLPPVTRLLLVGQPALDGGNLVAQYGWLWQQVAQGAQVLLLEPPAPGLDAYWPLAPPLITPAAAADCGADAFAPPLTDGLAADTDLRALLHPRLSFDLSGESWLDLYHWDGRLLFAHNQQDGYRGCHALVSYRLGRGWVSVTMLPLLQHFQDARARLYLMNLINAAARRKHAAPASPGLAWVMRKRMQKLAQHAAAAGGAVYYRAPPEAVESAPVLVPAASDNDPRTCWSVPASTRPGGSFTLRLGAARPIHALDVGASALPALRVEASHDGLHWLPLATNGGAGPVTVPVPAGTWQAFRLTVAAPGASWRLCQMSAE